MSNNPLISNMSYTSRDFNSIYPELLDLVKKITYKWDPSISNESDPGVILLKLNAIIADKCNYNIDKNVLECFPLSVTQESNARQLYEQLGYFMHWYRSAITRVSVYWKDFDNYTRSNTSYVEIPKFTMVTDYDNTIVYTLIGPAISELNAASNFKVYLNGEATIVNAIQGVAVNYSINGRDVIQASDLDSNNRLYFNDFDIAENGIFICNDNAGGSYNYADWKKKDNLVTENVGNTYYSFGVLPGSNTCYIEFPEDAETIFKNGIKIVYIRTLGRDGNIPAGRLEKLYNDLPSILTTSSSEEIALTVNSDVISLVNLISGEGGSDKESLQDAYRNYKHTIGTFNTLITLRDYMNAIINGPQLTSNVIVTDRTNDIQCSYKIMSSVNNLPTLVNKVDKHQDETTLDAYNIKIYALNYSAGTIDTLPEYNASFKLLNKNELAPIKLYIENQKAIPHDITDIRTPEQAIDSYIQIPIGIEPNDFGSADSEYYYVNSQQEYVKVMPGDTWVATRQYYIKDNYFRSHYCLFKNIYPIECRITPIRTLDNIEQAEVKANIQRAIYEELNSKKLEFGETITPYELESIITNSDERISSTSILNITLTTYVTYWNGKEFKDINLADSSATNPYLYSYNNPIYSTITAKDDFLELVGAENLSWGVFTFKCIKTYDSETWVMSRIDNNDGESAYQPLSGNIADYVDINTGGAWPVPSNGDWFSVEINPIDRMKDEIFVKSVLQGVTPLFINDNEFKYDIDQIKYPNTYFIDGIKSIETNVNIEVNNTNKRTYKLRDNESITFSTSNLIEGSKFSNYVKYLLVRSESIEANANVKLENGEFLFLFWKLTNDSNEPYTYEVYSEGFVVNPSFTIASVDTVPTELRDLANNVTNVGYDLPGAQGLYSRYMTSSSMYRAIDDSENTYASATIRNWLSENKTIQMKHTNAIRIDTSYNCYWVLNNLDENNKYVLFEDYSNVPQFDSTVVYDIGDKVYHTEDGVDEYYQCIRVVPAQAFNPQYWRKLPAHDYTLDVGEYLYYESLYGNGLNVLGPGTRIERPLNQLTEWSVPYIRQSIITSDGISALRNYWFNWPESAYMNVVEQQHVTIGSGAQLLFVYKSGTSTPYVINGQDSVRLDDISTVYYTFKDIDDPTNIQLYENSKLPDVGNVDSWYGKSILGLSIGDDEEQPLLEGQELYITFFSKNIYVLSGKPNVSPQTILYPTVIQSKFPIDAVNETGKVSVFQIDSDGNIIGDKLYVYAKSRSTNEDEYLFRNDGGATLMFNNPPDPSVQTKTISIEFSVPPNTENTDGYIISIYNPNDDLTGVSVTASLDGSVLYPIGEHLYTDLSKPGTYFFDVTLNDINPDSTHTISVTMSDLYSPNPKSIIINQLYKYHKPEKDDDSDLDISDADFVKYVELLQNFDYDNEYQYNYQVPEATMIKNPLLPISFTDPHHIYNKFTICKFDTDIRNSTIRISSR